MSLISIVRSVCDENGFPRPTAVAGSTDQLARQCLALLNKELRHLCKMNWPVLVREHEFDTVADTAEYDLPSDFKRLIVGSAFRADDYYPLKGSVSPQEWQARRNDMLATLDRSAFRIYGSPSKFKIVPTPTAAETLVYEYVTSNFAADSEGTAKEEFTVDTDVAAIDEELLQSGLTWRLLKKKGLEYAEEYNEHEALVRNVFAQQLALPNITIGGRRWGDVDGLTPGYVPENGFGD